MAIAEELQIIVDAKVNGAIADMKKVSGAIDNTGKSTSKLSGLFKQLAGPLAIGAVVAGTIKMGKEFSSAASNAEEIESKFRTVYRSIGDEAEESYQRLADSFDLADSTAQELLGTTGDLLTGLGFTQSEALGLSEQVNTLAIDLASFSNYAGGASGASEALTKALLGESEMAKGLGIVINQNTAEYKDAIKYYTEVEGKTLLQAKAYTALQFATEQSGNAIGDYARTSESTANTFRRLEESTTALKEALGQAVNEGITPMAGATATLVKNLADWVNKNTDINKFLENFDGKTIDASIAMDTLNASLAGLEQKLKGTKGIQNSYTIGLAEQIATLKILISQRARAASLDAQYADAKKAQDEAEMARIAELKRAADERASDMENLNAAFAKTTEGQKQALEASIAYFESFIKGEKALAVLADLKEQLAGLTQESENLFATEESNALMLKEYSDQRAIATARAMNGIDNQIEKVEELKMSYEDLASSGLGAFTSAFKEVGEGNRTLMQGLKDGAKDAISAMLEMYAQLWLAQAVASAASLNFVSAAGYTAASAAAYTASGAVQSMATGGSFVANQATPILVGEGGGSERVTVEPVGGSDSGGSQTTILSIDGTQFTAWMQSKLDNGGLRIPRRVIV